MQISWDIRPGPQYLMVVDFVRYYTRTTISHGCRFCEILHQNHNISWLQIANCKLLIANCFSVIWGRQLRTFLKLLPNSDNCEPELMKSLWPVNEEWKWTALTIIIYLKDIFNFLVFFFIFSENYSWSNPTDRVQAMNNPMNKISFQVSVSE